jgi:hypothetical protein
MIAFLHDHPLIRLPDGSLVAFERLWLVECLHLAGTEAGAPSWWAAPHVAESVSAFLKEEYGETAIDLNHLEDMVKSCLCGTGLEDVARRFALSHPPSRLSLAELARAAGNGYELHFFELLSSRLREALGSGCRRIECAELLPCVKILRSARRWRSDCRRLKSEIVEFIRLQAEAASVENLHIELS